MRYYLLLALFACTALVACPPLAQDGDPCDLDPENCSDGTPSVPERDPEASFKIVQGEGDQQSETEYTWTEGSNTIYCRHFPNNNNLLEVRFADSNENRGEQGTRLDFSACNFDPELGGSFDVREARSACTAATDFYVEWRQVEDQTTSLWQNSPAASCSFQIFPTGDEVYDGTFECDPLDPFPVDPDVDPVAITEGAFHCELEVFN